MGWKWNAKNNKAPVMGPQVVETQMWQWLALLAIVAAVALIRTRLLQMPLERDEGEFAYCGQLLLQGVPPYKLAYTMKLPGMCAAYALIMLVFGQNAAGIHFGFMLVNIATIVAIFFLAKHVFDATAGVAAAAAYAIMAINPDVLGLSAHATHFVILPALLGLLLVLRAIKLGGWWRFLSAGLLLGVAFLMKQPGIVFAVLAFLYIFYVQLSRRPVEWSRLFRNETWLLLGAMLPIGLVWAALWHTGVGKEFWFWTFSYGRLYASETPLSLGLQLLKIESCIVSSKVLCLLFLSVIGIGVAVWDKKALNNLPFTLGFFVLSFIGVCSGLYFRPHYFVLLMPSVALFVGVSTETGTAQSFMFSAVEYK